MDTRLGVDGLGRSPSSISTTEAVGICAQTRPDTLCQYTYLGVQRTVCIDGEGQAGSKTSFLPAEKKPEMTKKQHVAGENRTEPYWFVFVMTLDDISMASRTSYSDLLHSICNAFPENSA